LTAPKQSPESERVENLTTPQLHQEVCEITGCHSKQWTTDVGHIIELAESLKILNHPRYFARTQAGNWTVREHQCPQPITKHKSLAVAICQAVVILTNGRGNSYSEHTPTE
jgi:hypothetical protein